MKQRLFFFITLLAALTVQHGAFSQDYDFGYSYQGNTLYYNIIDDGVEVTLEGYYNNYASVNGTLVIPDTVEYDSTRYAVTRIGQDAFYQCGSIVSVVIPNTVISIEQEAFVYCDNMASVVIGSGVTQIGYGNFSMCHNLASIEIAEGNTVFDSRDSSNAIIRIYNSSLVRGCRTTVIPNNITAIEDMAFSEVTGIESIVIPASVMSIGRDAFRGCSITNVHIPSASLAEDAFAWSSLVSVTLGDSVRDLQGNPFTGCGNLVSIAVSSGNPYIDSRDSCNAVIETSTNILKTGCKTSVIPQTVSAIGYSAFQECGDLTSILIPNSVTRIYSNAFYHCAGLVDVTLGNSVAIIDGYAFAGCGSLHSIAIPSSVGYIGNMAFGQWDYWDNLPVFAITMRGATPPTIFSETFPTPSFMIVPCGHLVQYQEAYANLFYDSITEGATILFDDMSYRHGSVEILSQPTCSSPAVVRADAIEGYHFGGWADGCQDNPRTLALGTDSIPSLLFVGDNLNVYTYVNHPAMGNVVGGGIYPRGDTVSLYALVQRNYTFLGWSNGAEENPYILVVENDTTITAVFDMLDTVWLDTAFIHDTTYVNVHDTTYVDVFVHDTAYIDVPYAVHDTTYVDIHDTTYIDVPYAVHDTTYIDIHDTTYIDVPYAVHDTTYIDVHDTTYIDVPYAVHDTMVVTLMDTVINTVYDTVVNMVYDTVDNYVYDTVTNTIYDTVTNTLYDTIDNYIYDTTVVTLTDTLWLMQYDTVYITLHDTIIIHDTVFVPQDGINAVAATNIRLYQRGGCIVVEDADGGMLPKIAIYDAVGRRLSGERRVESGEFEMPVPASGVYIVKVGDRPARRVVVVK